MIVSMACPKCGGQASEYDVGKWACLKCHNKFLYAPPPPPPATVINNSISIQGSGMFDLDASNARRPTPVFKSQEEVNLSIDGELKQIRDTIAEYENKIFPLARPSLWFACCWLGLGYLYGNWLIPLRLKEKEPIEGSLFFLFVLFGIPAGIGLICFFVYRDCLKKSIKRLRDEAKALEARRYDAVLVGHTVNCPHCISALVYVLIEDPMPSGLQHCLSCGKQFFTAEGYSYPLVHHQSASIPPVTPIAFAVNLRPVIKMESIGCPLCGQPLRLVSISAGRNTCPHCAGVFEVG